MNPFKVVVLGTVQGIAEFLPISSSGHLLLLKKIMGLEVPIVFDIYLHFATVLVVVIYYRYRILELFLSLVRFFLRRSTLLDLDNLKTILLIATITFVTAFVGIFIGTIEVLFTSNVVLLNFVLTGVLLLLIESELLALKLKDYVLFSGVFIGFMQGVGVMPGISRSGITIFASVFLGFSRTKAFEISFLSLIPIVFGSLLLRQRELFSFNMVFNFFEINLGALVAFVIGLFSMGLFFRTLKESKTYYFSAYLFFLSGIVYFFL
ncbi:undecaprenyl-diphosphate phosphatase [Borrelia sp. BU AG58]|uniref:undecaprenyl-diphosphate phosphatase n=1 Tax=Borrelia sp. BU AG58 TaxID=2887345 RepID=UPI001E59A865|nr:undecaprenyl-diphosphate phosphatase [Borrelia sp. BU AG58]UER67450.1 undecaprenyl-diphosphate phosphatase [Borrelia sp. BU AG58]